MTPPSPSSYENQFASYLGPDVSAFAFWKGRVALYAILKALEIGDGDEVIIPGFTCVVVPNAVRFAGARPVYVDIPANGYNLDLAEVAAAITPKTKALVIQHTFGIPADLEKLLPLAEKHKLFVIEDCAHTLGTQYKGQLLGSFGHAAFFSSQWSKPYTTGLGGIAATRDPDLASRLRVIQAGFDSPTGQAQLRLFVQYRLYQQFFTPALYWRAQSLLHSLGHLGLVYWLIQ